MSHGGTDYWTQFTGGRLFDLHKTVHRISPPWVESISVGARETAKLIYKTMKLTGRITKITVPEVFAQTTKRGSELVGTIVIRHSLTEPGGKTTNQNVNSRYTIRRIHMSSILYNNFRIRINRAFLQRPFLHEPHEISTDFVSNCLKDNEAFSSINHECRYETENIPIHIIVPLSGRPSALEAFLGRFEELIKVKGEQLHLTVVNFPQNLLKYIF